MDYHVYTSVTYISKLTIDCPEPSLTFPKKRDSGDSLKFSIYLNINKKQK